MKLFRSVENILGEPDARCTWSGRILNHTGSSSSPDLNASDERKASGAIFLSFELNI